jgi:hypothetical protein
MIKSEIMAQSELINKIQHTDYLENVHNGRMKDLSALHENPLTDRGSIDAVCSDYNNHA